MLTTQIRRSFSFAGGGANDQSQDEFCSIPSDADASAILSGLFSMLAVHLISNEGLHSSVSGVMSRLVWDYYGNRMVN